jgi:DNA N-6-adenine-methyltransferase Dam
VNQQAVLFDGMRVERLVSAARPNPAAIMNSSESIYWYTPSLYVEAARSVMGAIDLDPASDVVANQVVKATRFYDLRMNGLAHPWHGRVFLNPPYCRQQGKFVRYLMGEYGAGRVKQAVVLVSSAAMNTRWFRPFLDFPLCLPTGRVQFYSPGVGESSSQHGSVFVYLGQDIDRFIEIFERFGPVLRRVGA